MKFLQDITLGQFMPGGSFLHLLDPRTKLLSLILLMAAAFVIQSYRAMAVLWACFFLTLCLSGLSWGYVFRGVRAFLWLFVFTAAIHLFFTPGPSLPFFPLGFVDVTWPGLAKGVFVAAQLSLAILFSSLMTLTTSPLQLAYGLEKLLSPLKRFRVPVGDFSLMTMLAIKLIPVLLGETQRIIKAQSARGVDFESGNLFRDFPNGHIFVVEEEPLQAVAVRPNCGANDYQRLLARQKRLTDTLFLFMQLPQDSQSIQTGKDH